MTLLKIVIIIIIIIIIIGLIWLTGLYLMLLSNTANNKYNKDKIFYYSSNDAKIMKTISNSSLPLEISTEVYSLGFWFYVEQWNDIQDQSILTKGIGLCVQPNIYLSKKNNNIIIELDKNSLDDTSVCLHESIEIIDIPVKRWVHFYMNVQKNVVNVYINGQLVKSHVLQSPIKQNTNDILINKNSGFNGLMAKILISNNVKSYEDIRKIYNKGPYGYSITDMFKDLYNKNISKLTNIFDICNR